MEQLNRDEISHVLAFIQNKKIQQTIRNDFLEIINEVLNKYMEPGDFDQCLWDLIAQKIIFRILSNDDILHCIGKRFIYRDISMSISIFPNSITNILPKIVLKSEWIDIICIEPKSI